MNTRVIIGTIAQLFVVYTTVSGYCSTPAPHPKQIPDYYWRDYLGVIPEDAVAGGTDELGYYTYIGQVYIKDFELLPAIITRGCTTVNTTAYAKELTTDKNVKILCTRSWRKFEWVATNHEQLPSLGNRHFVLGGTEIGHNLHIGRANYDGRLIIGKIFPYPLSSWGLAVPYNGKPMNFQSYELLTYNFEK